MFQSLSRAPASQCSKKSAANQANLNSALAAEASIAAGHGAAPVARSSARGLYCVPEATISNRPGQPAQSRVVYHNGLLYGTTTYLGSANLGQAFTLVP